MYVLEQVSDLSSIFLSSIQVTEKKKKKFFEEPPPQVLHQNFTTMNLSRPLLKVWNTAQRVSKASTDHGSYVKTGLIL